MGSNQPINKEKKEKKKKGGYGYEQLKQGWNDSIT